MKTELKTYLITNYMNVNNLNKTSFCKLCKISLSTFNKIMEGKNNYGIISLFKIAKVLKIHICDLF